MLAESEESSRTLVDHRETPDLDEASELFITEVRGNFLKSINPAAYGIAIHDTADSNTIRRPGKNR